ncbi:21721_t:CDS:2 [Entrophospora sp. SA101]|nr:21721_t:CDS:2 [Entrophospora sp. SA101]
MGQVKSDEQATKTIKLISIATQILLNIYIHEDLALKSDLFIVENIQEQKDYEFYDEDISEGMWEADSIIVPLKMAEKIMNGLKKRKRIGRKPDLMIKDKKISENNEKNDMNI